MAGPPSGQGRPRALSRGKSGHFSPSGGRLMAPADVSALNSLRAAGTRGSRVDPRRSSYAQAPDDRGGRAPGGPGAAPAGVWDIPTPAPGLGPAARSAAAA